MEKSIGNLIKQERIKRGWTQRELARRVGVHFTTVCRWERGNREPYRVKALADLFDIPIRRLAR